MPQNILFQRVPALRTFLLHRVGAGAAWAAFYSFLWEYSFTVKYSSPTTQPPSCQLTVGLRHMLTSKIWTRNLFFS